MSNETTAPDRLAMNEFENWVKWLVLDLSPDTVGILVLGSQEWLWQGSVVKALGKVLDVWVGEEQERTYFYLIQ